MIVAGVVQDDEATTSSRGRFGDSLAAWVAAAALTWGALVAVRYHRLDLTLSHYDARGHLVVARRIFDSITPGWLQIGAVWLPLPHLLNALPVQIDLFYRTGASGVAISIVSFATAAASIAWIVASLTGSSIAAAAAAAVFALNPNVLYLQATPMTEPLLLACTCAAVALLIADVTGPPHPRRRVTPSTAAGLAFALACLTRYEAWPVTVTALACAAWARWRRGEPIELAVRRVARIAIYPAVAILGFLIFSRAVVGEWFVAGGFFVPENEALGHPFTALAQIAWGTRALSGMAMLVIAMSGAAAAVVLALVDRRRASIVIPIALAATAALPAVAFYDGHPYRIRYMVPLIAAEAVFAGVAAGLIGASIERVVRASTTLRALAPIALLAFAAFELHPLDATAPMVAEAQWDRPNVAARARVGACLAEAYHGETIMASMGSLGHYMQELSRRGFRLRDFLHEGNGDIWLAALNGPRPYAGWLLIEEKAEGGDMLAGIARENPRFLNGFSRVCDGAGVALYRRGPLEAHAERGGVAPPAQINLRN